MTKAEALKLISGPPGRGQIGAGVKAPIFREDVSASKIRK